MDSDLCELIVEAQASFYGNDIDRRPSFIGISPDREAVIMSYDIGQMPVGWWVGCGCREPDVIIKHLNNEKED